MRIIWKLSAFALLGVLMQRGIARYADDLDEGMFILRVGVAHARGAEIDSAELVVAAARLNRRRLERHGASPPQHWDHRHAALASANDF